VPACTSSDQLADLPGFPPSALGQSPDLVGHDRIALAVLARPRCLNGRVERQQVGLRSNIVNRFNDLADTIAQLAKLPDLVAATSPDTTTSWESNWYRTRRR
jgi:hypothetical protein